MATMRDIVDSAAKRLRIVGAGEDLPPEHGADILSALNDMMASWEKKGVNIAWPGSLTLNNTFPLDDAHIEGVKAMLAVRVAGDFGKVADQETRMAASDGWTAIQGDYILPDAMAVDEALANMPSQRRVGRG